MTITAAADGSALGNPGPAGWAWYVNDDCWRAGGWPHGTNNQGELMAVLDLFRCTAHLPDEELHILCDSQYVINSVTKWMPGWKRKGWRKADGKPVLNVEILREIDQALAGRKYRFEWVRGHAGHDLNEPAPRRRELPQRFQDRQQMARAVVVAVRLRPALQQVAAQISCPGSNSFHRRTSTRRAFSGRCRAGTRSPLACSRRVSSPPLTSAAPSSTSSR